ncbi:MAG: Gfo/Idh/MocA family oxidoreductase, partial [Verrucomicrobiales bacterium]
MPPLNVAIIGCGSRGRTYARLMADSAERYQLVAGADPVRERLELISAFAHAGFRSFRDGSALLAEPRLADLVVVATQDADHLSPTLAALE